MEENPKTITKYEVDTEKLLQMMQSEGRVSDNIEVTESVILDSLIFENDISLNCRFNGKILLTGCHFKGDFEMPGQCDMQVTMVNCTIDGELCLNGEFFSHVSLKSIICKKKFETGGAFHDGIAIDDSCRFQGDALIGGIFEGSEERDLEIEGVYLKDLRIEFEILNLKTRIKCRTDQTLSIKGVYGGRISIEGKHNIVRINAIFLNEVAANFTFDEFYSSNPGACELIHLMTHKIFHTME